MNEERKERLIRATELLGQIRGIVESVRDEESVQYGRLTAEQQEEDFGFGIQTTIDELADLIDELDNAQTAMVDLVERLHENDEEHKFARYEDDEDRLIAALGWDASTVRKNIARLSRMCARMGIDLGTVLSGESVNEK